MSFAEIIDTLPNLKCSERRELARRLFELDDEEAALLKDCDQRADERFQTLDALETEAGQARAR